MRTQIYTYAHKHAHTHMHTHTYTHVHSHSHAYVRTAHNCVKIYVHIEYFILFFIIKVSRLHILFSVLRIRFRMHTHPVSRREIHPHPCRANWVRNANHKQPTRLLHHSIIYKRVTFVLLCLLQFFFLFSVCAHKCFKKENKKQTNLRSQKKRLMHRPTVAATIGVPTKKK